MAPAKKKPVDAPQPAPAADKQPANEVLIKDRKLQVIAMVQQRCADPIWIERLLKIAHGDESKIMRAVNSYTTFIANDQGARQQNGGKKYICEASLSSLFSCFLEAFQMGLEIGGGRDHVAIVVYQTQAELEVTYKGFAYALARHFDNSFVQCGLIFKGDEFDAEISGSTANYRHKPKNLLSQKWETLEGVFCFFEYTNRDDKNKVSRLVVVDKAGVEMIRSKARSKYTWSDFWGEMSLKAAIRRASKLPFAAIDFGEFEIDPGTTDNKHFMLEDKSGGADRLSRLMEKQQEIMNDDKPASPQKKPEEERGMNPGQDSAPKPSPTPEPENEAVRYTDTGQGEIIEGTAVSTPQELTDGDFEENDSGR